MAQRKLPKDVKLVFTRSEIRTLCFHLKVEEDRFRNLLKDPREVSQQACHAMALVDLEPLVVRFEKARMYIETGVR
jgi:hypothetical protein